MAIEVSKRGGGYTARVTPPHGDWSSEEPMSDAALYRALVELGVHPVDVADAINDADPGWVWRVSGQPPPPEPPYRQLALAEWPVRPWHDVGWLDMSTEDVQRRTLLTFVPWVAGAPAAAVELQDGSRYELVADRGPAGPLRVRAREPSEGGLERLRAGLGLD